MKRSEMSILLKADVRWAVTLFEVFLRKNSAHLNRLTPFNGDAVYLSVSRTKSVNGRNLIQNYSFVCIAGKIGNSTGSLISHNDVELQAPQPRRGFAYPCVHKTKRRSC